MMRQGTAPELLAPAGSFEAAMAAFTYGADAIYLGLERFSARADAANFGEDALRRVVAYAHNLGRKVYVTLNTLVESREFVALREPLALMEAVAVDGVIVQDLGLAAWMRRDFPRLALHASTQLACTSLAGARALKDLGFVRIVTARELSLREAAEIGRRAGVEVEVFVHGALCYSLSGLCLYSSLTTGRSGNRGRCAYCCRQPFRPWGGEPCHPFSMRDLALLGQIKTLRALPLASLKIEGRMKNPLYVAAVTDLYRGLLDGTLSAAQTSLFQQELERAEEEAGQLRSKVSQLEKTVQDTKNDAAREIQKLQTQVSVLSEQNLQLQKSEQLCQTYKKQLQELQNGHLDAGEYQTKLVSLEAELRGKAELENRLTTYLEENKRLQSEVLRYQQRCSELEERVESLQNREKELSNDLAVLQQRNDSLQLLVSGPSSETVSPVSHSNSTVALDQLLVESPSPRGKAIAEPIPPVVNVRNSPEYLEQANELLLANERSIVLNVREEGEGSEA